MICLGLWPGTPLLRLERIAVNIADFEIPDNVGHMTRGPVVEGGAEAYRSTLPIHAIQDRLLAAGIPARLSGSAGTYLCNALMYHALRACAEHAPGVPCGFIHLPYLPEQVASLLLQMREWAKVELHQRADLASDGARRADRGRPSRDRDHAGGDLRLMAEPILELRQVSKRFDKAVPADDVSLAIEPGEFFTFLGPSGSGKSTLLRIVAGLEQADAGLVLLRGRDVGGVPPWRRHLGMVFQQYANFPHMNVAQNVAYGLRRRGLGPAEIKARVAELLDLVGLVGFEERRVTQLSGGEQQRVAIARALAPRPELLLLDEPLAALDEKIRREMQGELTKIQEATGTTFVYVTHDQEEALTMSDRIAVLNRGRCVQVDAPERIFRFPRTRFVAGFFRGCNVLEASLEQDDHGAALVLGGRRLALTRGKGGAGSQGVAVRGESLLLGEQARSAELVLPAVLERITYRGVYQDYRLRLDDGQVLSATLTQRLPLIAGSRVEVGIRADEIVLLEED